ncbi:LOW QUALITY PROTEIN: hypothetical protein Cgig2_020191 [Carnegiea gigantea]|uniref:Uncharacterized protein n=1 Tax=Carnegiea gigantea TaxID=171969 RepID=A0A9Q1QQL9_9CARY|nr:LOW QUALITY PROTEIN: hypothetical protein Cgig2_020191 [Carnegiea gigantea]
MSLREGLRTCHNDFESLDMAAAAAVNKRLVVYLVYMVDVPKEVVPEMPALPCPSMATQQSNVDPMSSSINDGEEYDQNGGLMGQQAHLSLKIQGAPDILQLNPLLAGKSKRSIRKAQLKNQFNQTPTLTPTPTPTPTSAATPIPSLTNTTQKAHSHDTTSNFNVNNEHAPEWDWEDPRPESPIPWDKMIEEFGDSEYVPETEVDLEAFEDIAGSISKVRGKRKINVGGGIDDDGCENDDEWEANVEDLETSDEEWAAAKAKVSECKKQKGSGRINNSEQVGKQDMTANKSSTSGIEQTQLGSNFHSDYETSEAEMDTDEEIDGDVPRLLRKKEKPIKVDEHTDFKKLKWQVGMTFETVQGCKDVISSKPREQGETTIRGEEELEAGEDIPPSSESQSMTE